MSTHQTLTLGMLSSAETFTQLARFMPLATRGSDINQTLLIAEGHSCVCSGTSLCRFPVRLFRFPTLPQLLTPLPPVSLLATDLASRSWRQQEQEEHFLNCCHQIENSTFAHIHHFLFARVPVEAPPKVASSVCTPDHIPSFSLKDASLVVSSPLCPQPSI